MLFVVFVIEFSEGKNNAFFLMQGLFAFFGVAFERDFLREIERFDGVNGVPSVLLTAAARASYLFVT